MEQVALYRKYRPHNFDNLVGQDHIKTTLINALKNNRVSHAYIFSGPRGTGKTSTARLLAKALNCTSLKDGFEPCNECEFCNDIAEGRLIDLIEIDAASNRGIDEVRDLKEKINFAPTRTKYKVYIIDEVHMMTKEAFNALLKTLEEPPSHAFFILATTEIHKIPETIISRCQRFDFKRISQKALMTRLSYIAQLEDIKAEDQALEAISRYVDGGLRDAIGLMEQLTTSNVLTTVHVQDVLGISSFGVLEDLFIALESCNSVDALKIIHELHDQGSDLRKFTHEFIDSLRQKMLDAISGNDIQKTTKLITMIETFQDAQEKLSSTNIPQLPLEIAIIKICGPVNSPIPVVQAEQKINVVEDRKAQPIKIPQKSDIDLNFFQENWPRITERVKSPALRMSLKSTLPIKVDEHSVVLQFNTNFHKDTVMNHGYRVELESAIYEVTNVQFKIISVLKTLDIKPLVEEKKENNSAVDEALNIFGGEILN